jgi:hypothetical protein
MPINIRKMDATIMIFRQEVGRLLNLSIINEIKVKPHNVEIQWSLTNFLNGRNRLSKGVTRSRFAKASEAEIKRKNENIIKNSSLDNFISRATLC